MEAGWRTIAKTIVATALVTTTFWFVVSAWYLRHMSATPQSATPQVPPSAESVASSGGAGDHRSARMAEPAVGRLVIPVAGVKPGELTDTFTQAREDGARRHDAIDILAPRGTLVVAAAPGRVDKLFLSDDGGKTVYIRSPDRRRIYYYAHLDRYAPQLREGERIDRGTRLGTVGSTGNANPEAPHLHFAIWHTTPDAQWYDDGAAINPYRMLGGK